MAIKMSNKQINAIAETIRIPEPHTSIVTWRHDRAAYNTGMYGHNWDAYYINGKAFIIGQRNLTGRPANNLEEYIEKWESVNHNYEITWQERDKLLAELQEEFVAQA